MDTRTMYLTVLMTCAFFMDSHGLLLNRAMDHDVLSGRQWDELITRNGTIFMPAALAMYSPECDSKLQEYKMSQNMPPDYALLFGRYDYKTTPKYSWLTFDKRDNLYQRYKPVDCFELLYFAPNSSLEHPTKVTMEKSKKLSEVLWDLAKVKFSVRNLFGGDIEVRLSVDEHPKSATILHPGEEEDATAFITHWLEVYDYTTGNFIHAQRIDHKINSTEIVIDRYSVVEVGRDDWISQTRMNTREIKAEYSNYIQQTSQNYLLNFKQPPIVENLTETGYKVRDIPSFFIKDLKDFVKKNKNNILNISITEHKYQSLPITDEMDMKVSMVMKLMLEDWANADLQPTSTNDIRIYRKGATFGSKVGNIEKEVVGFIVAIDQEPAGKKGWILEVTGHDSKRTNVTLKPGEAMFVEPASVIVGSPYPYNGKKFVLLQYFYTLEHDWDWKISSDGKYILKDEEQVESISIFATSKALERSEKRKKREEL